MEQDNNFFLKNWLAQDWSLVDGCFHFSVIIGSFNVVHLKAHLTKDIKTTKITVNERYKNYKEHQDNFIIFG